MKIQEVIDYVDSVKPNAFPSKAKIEWLSDIDSMIKNEVIKEYKSFEIVGVKGKVEYDLPTGVKFDDIVKVFVDNKEIDKIDLRSINTEGYFKQNENKISIYPQSNDTAIKVIYQVRLKRYRAVEIILLRYWPTTFSYGFISNANFVNNGFEVGDSIEISGCSILENNSIVQIAEIANGYIEFNTNFTHGTVQENITLTKLMYDELLIQAPYDKIYSQYIIAQIDWFNREYEAYNNDIELYNASYKEFVNSYKQRAPLETITVKNIW